MKKILLSFLLILTLIIPSFAAVADSIDIDYNADGENITISIYGEINSSVSIVIEDNTKKYYIDQGWTDSQGKATFSTKLEKGKEYTCSVKIGEQQKKVNIVLKDEDSQDSEETEIAYIYIKGYKGVILSKTKVKIQKNDTVMSLTKRVLRENDIKYESKSGYISSIDGQAEKDKGAESGWMFSVNGNFPDVGADSVEVRDGDYIKWLYTSDLGEDVGNSYEKENTTIEEAEDILNDDESTQEEIIDAVETITEYFKETAKDIKTEEEVMEVIKEAGEINEMMLEALNRTETEKLAKHVAEKSIEIIQNFINMLGIVTEQSSTQKIDEMVQANMGIALNSIDKVEDQNDIDEIIDDMLEISNTMWEKIGSEQIKTNKILGKSTTILVPQAEKEKAEVKIPCRFLEKASERQLTTIKIKTEIVSFKITPNIIDSKPKEKTLKLSANKIDTSEISEEIKHMIPTNSIIIDLKAEIGDEDLTQFNQPVEIAIPYKGVIKDEKALTAFLLKDDNSIEPVGGIYDTSTNTLKFITNHFSKYFIKESKKQFEDIKEHWAEKEISIMAGKGIIRGKSEERFDPNENISRAEFSALISRMLKYTVTQKHSMPFKDVGKTSWYYDPVLAAFKNGIINGKTKAKFDPDGEITRQEMAKMISKVLEGKSYKKGDIADLSVFVDKEDISPWARQVVALAAREKIIKGVGENRFAPKEKATRAQAAVMLYRLYDLIFE